MNIESRFKGIEEKEWSEWRIGYTMDISPIADALTIVDKVTFHYHTYKVQYKVTNKEYDPN